MHCRRPKSLQSHSGPCPAVILVAHQQGQVARAKHDGRTKTVGRLVQDGRRVGGSPVVGDRKPTVARRPIPRTCCIHSDRIAARQRRRSGATTTAAPPAAISRNATIIDEEQSRLSPSPDFRAIGHCDGSDRARGQINLANTVVSLSAIKRSPPHLAPSPWVE